MAGLVQDVRYALRALRRDLGFFLFAALIVGLGIGATTAVFSVMNPLMLKPLPFHHPEDLVWVANQRTGGMSMRTSRTSNLRDFRSMNESFEALTGYFAFFEYESYNLSGDGLPERLVGVGVAQDFLPTLGIDPLVGRNFVDEESVWDGRPAVILTHGFWTRRYAADPGMVGRSIVLNDEANEVVGVLPPDFDFSSIFTPGSEVDFLYPFPISDETDQWGNTLAMIGRLRPGATVQSAQAELDLIVDQLQEADPDRWGLDAAVSPLQEQISGSVRSAMLLLAAAAGAVMLIACANLSNLLLARGPNRQKEMAVRSALGASRHRLTRQLLFESLILALAGGAIGVAVAFGATSLVAGTSAVRIPMLHSVSVDGSTLLFSFAVALAAGLIIGVVPALQMASGREAAAMSDSSRGSSEGRRSAALREGLVVAEVALSCVLLVGGGLLLRSFSRVMDVNLGYEPAGAMSWRVDTPAPFEDLASANVYYDQLVANVMTVPGVEAVGLSDCLPLGRNRTWGIRAQGVVYDEGQNPSVFPRIIDHRYLQAMEIPLLAGRYFTADDTDETRPVLVVNETAAREVFPEREALGGIILMAGQEWEVVGIVGDVRHQALEQASGGEMYIPMTQSGWPTLEMVVRSSLPPETLIPGVRRALESTDPTLPTGDFHTLESVVDKAVSPRRFTLILLGSFAGTALLLAALGIYSVLSYTVSRRVPEIGIRMALGESGGQVLTRVVARTMTLAGIGIVIGGVGSYAASRLIASLLYGVEPTDSLTFGSMVAILLAVAALAGFLPARRASRTDPMAALRTE
ncbi:MAG: ABC transporter permease [Gemmatimonadota bacterium]|jgi:predicted permease